MQDRLAAGGAAGPSDGEAIKALCARHGNRPGALIEILHDLQAERGHVPQAALPVIAEALNLSRAEVHGVVTFYHDFRREPAGRHVLKLCRAEACQSVGAEAMIAALTRALGVELGGTTADGRVTLEAVYCLGNCALGPAALLDGKLIGRASQAKLQGLLNASRST